MNTLLIVGNGFDLNMGFPTSFQDFLRYYVKTDVERPSDNVRKLKQLIQSDIVQWSDLELKLGEVTTEYSTTEDFSDTFRNIRDELSRYLECVDRLQIVNAKSVAERMLRDLAGIDQLIDLPYKSKYWKFMENVNESDRVEVNVMTFNYTRTFERLLQELQGNLVNESNITINAPVHIHETLESGLMMGVNDGSQIANTDFRNGYLVKNLMVKPLINKEYEDGTDKVCREMISQADLIILYGLSIGATDQAWWKEIYQSVYNRNRAVVYVPYDSARPIRRKEEILISCKDFASALCAKMQVPPNLYSDVLDCIIPIRQNRFFDFGTDKNLHNRNFRKVCNELEKIQIQKVQ